MKTVNILGSTGSIGTNTLDVIKKHPEEFQVYGLTANKNAERLIQQAKEFSPNVVAIADATQYSFVKEALAETDITVMSGQEGVANLAQESVDLTMAAIVGMAGLTPTMNAIENSKQVAFATKECLVSAGQLMMNAVRENNIDFLPVDSEHNAIFQVFDDECYKAKSIERLILTASGGPFLDRAVDSLKAVTPEEAVKHPNWSMGAKISIDSATMMNKALEVIEAHYLFDMPTDKIDVVIHPQSIIHSMVEYADGSILAQLGAPDMRTPITYSLGYPKRLQTSGERLNLKQLQALEFKDVDDQKFPSVGLAYDCLNAGQSACIAFNAANEVLVEAFLNKKIPYLDIIKNIRYIIETSGAQNISSISDVVEYDAEIRDKVYTEILNDQIASKRKA